MLAASSDELDHVNPDLRREVRDHGIVKIKFNGLYRRDEVRDVH